MDNEENKPMIALLPVHRSFIDWLKMPHTRYVVLGAVALIAIIIAVLVTYARYSRERHNENPEGGNPLINIRFGDEKEKSEEKAAAKLDGSLVIKEFVNRRPLAVMIENHPDARPQFGLDKACVVFEAIAEGGITRFLAIFGSQNVDKIGPVRSARPYFVQWSSGWKALYAHAGGSEGGLALIPKAPVVDLQHNQTAFWREARGNVAVEHTLYTSTDRLYNYGKQKGASLDGDFTAWNFEDDPDSTQRGTAQHAVIDFSSASYKVEWMYDQTKDNYSRTLAGVAHKDGSTHEQLVAKNIIITTISRQNDPNANNGKGEWTMNTIGEGKVKILKHGRLIEGSWKKSAIGEMIRFYDGDGKEVSLGRGLTWIESAPPDISVTVE